MTRLRPLLCTAVLAWSSPLWAETPQVVTDILPVHGLVARVMHGLGTPDLLLPPGASPHGHAMRPSEARFLEEADIVVWTGPDLTPWLEGPLQTLAGDATRVTLIDAPGTHLLPTRSFDGHDDDHGHDHGHDHGAEDEHHGHDHGEMDPHAWLDPENAATWLDAIADALGRADPENAERYAENAREGAAEIRAAASEIASQITGLRDKPLVVFHDSTQYFERRFGLEAVGALSLVDGAAPGPARVSLMRERIGTLGVPCLFIEVQANEKLARAALEGSTAKLVTIDPLGTTLEPGPDYYPRLIQSLGAAFASCG